MKLQFDVEGRSQADPYIFGDGGRFYLYVTGWAGVEAYETDDPFGLWKYRGVVTSFSSGNNFWAPSVIKIGQIYYMYVSCTREGHFEHMFAASSQSPLGPFGNEKKLYGRFSIDSHIVRTGKGLYLWYARNDPDAEKAGTRVCLDRLADPCTPEGDTKEVVTPLFPEEKNVPQSTPERDWYTIEGPFWFREGEWQYLMYSAGCYRDDSYHIGYAAAKTSEEDLKAVDFVRVTKDGGFRPVIMKNEFEEGTGHHSILRYRGEYYAVYHGRDVVPGEPAGKGPRTGRICRLSVRDGVITAERFADHI